MPIQRNTNCTGLISNPGENYASAANQGHRTDYLRPIVDEGVRFSAEITQEIGCLL